LRDLVRAGKVRHFGLSEPGVQTIRRTHATAVRLALATIAVQGGRHPEHLQRLVGR
jgi:aryl-alcohol dehydrogenase-like predicted oxidoreductase